MIAPVRAAMMSEAKSNWIAAAELGIISSTFSTAVSHLSAARIGRDAPVDWMTVAAIPGRDWMISIEPSWSAVFAGIAFHQWADFSWAIVFFGLLGRWTAGLSPLWILTLAIPWAILSSALEWFVLVPLFPFWQPLFSLQQPYWIGLLVHMSSAAIYPLFAGLRWPFGIVPESRDIKIARVWGIGGAAVICVLAGVALTSRLGWEWPWIGANRDADQTYMRHMTTHHAQGIALARLGVDRANDPHLKSLAALMVASQSGENRIFEGWWQGWFALLMPACTAQERADMPGYLTADQMQEVRSATADQFDRVFIRLMTIHHAGAIRMADEELQSDGDPRLRIMAHAIRHEQQGEIALMQGMTGLAAVRAATRNMLADNIN